MAALKAFLSSPWAIWLGWMLCSVMMAAANFGEASITSLSVARLKGLKAIYGGPFWEAAKRWLSHPEEYLTLLLFIQNMFEVFFTWTLLMGLSVFIEGDTARDVVTLVVGGMINLVLLTVYPKVLARSLSHGIAGVWILRILYAILIPFYPLLRFFFVVVGKLSGGGRQPAGTLGKGVYLSLEELRELVDLAGTLGKGGFYADTGDYLERGVMEMMAKYLRLKDVFVRDVMTPRANASIIDWNYLISSPAGSPQRQRLEFSLMTDGHTRTIALGKDAPVGYIHAKDLLTLLYKTYEKDTPVQVNGRLVDSTVLRPILAVHARQKLINVLPLLLRGGPIAYVVDGNEWIGLITAEDCLEEITGEILDEFEPRKRSVRAQREALLK